MDNKFILSSNKIPEEREVAVDLSTLLTLMDMDVEMLCDLIHYDDVSEVKKALYAKNDAIDIDLLYRLFWYAVSHYEPNVLIEDTSAGKVYRVKKGQEDKVKCTRRLKDAANKEIKRRIAIRLL